MCGCVHSIYDANPAGVIVKWEKDIGDLVNVDDVVAVVETDKVSIEIRSENRGILAVQHAAVDDSVRDMHVHSTSACMPAHGIPPRRSKLATHCVHWTLTAPLLCQRSQLKPKIPRLLQRRKMMLGEERRKIFSSGLLFRASADASFITSFKVCGFRIRGSH